MIRFPHGKINLGLSVLSKRADGFHDLETVFYPIGIRDVLEIVPAPVLGFFPSGLTLTGDPDDNLVLRAYRLLRHHYPQVGPLSIYLHKSIPSGAGLGGGSSDASGMLMLLNDFFILNIPAERLAAFASELGSDCSFFLHSSPCYAQGRGEILEPVALDLSPYSILLVHPEIPVSTAWAFSRIHPALPKFPIREILSGPPAGWRDRLLNDFEIPVFRQYPRLEKIKMRLYEAGALYASLTGSGSSLYGIFRKNQIPAGGIDVSAQQSFLP